MSTTRGTDKIKFTEDECPIKPYGLAIVIIQDRHDEKTKAGIIVDQVEKDELPTGEVVAVGSEIGARIHKGDKVMFRSHKPVEYADDGVVYRIISEGMIEAIITKKEDESSN